MKGHVQALRQGGAQRGLAGAAQAGERNPVHPVGRFAEAEGFGQKSICLGQFVRLQALQLADEQCQIDRPLAALADQVGQRHAHRFGDLAQQGNGNIALADFELGQIALRNAGRAGQDPARHATPRTRRAHALAEPGQVGVQPAVAIVPGVRRGRVGRRSCGGIHTAGPVPRVRQTICNIMLVIKKKTDLSCASFTAGPDICSIACPPEAVITGILPEICWSNGRELKILVGTMTGTAEMVAGGDVRHAR